QRPPHRHPPPPGRFPRQPGVYYLYDNTTPQSSYCAGEPCTLVCQSAPSVRCSSARGACKGLADRLICDGQTFMCP
ncbi:MAG TPA: hypothetical protein VN999_14595, partial [Thermoanaerobaculia bacterium]|nr:hypothetical protein [Thermoanaerobaculia bacterium]